jgi:hypothetical protein
MLHAKYRCSVDKMNTLTNLEGSCPVCGTSVPRVKALWPDGTHEVYKCPDHGSIEYGPRSLSLLEDARAPGWRPLAIFEI